MHSPQPHTAWPLHPCSLLPVLPAPPPPSPRRGAVLSGSLKPCLYCQRTCRHLPPLEHLVLSCWARTENCTIGSPMNCYFWTRDKHTALYGLYLQSVPRQGWDFYLLSVESESFWCFNAHNVKTDIIYMSVGDPACKGLCVNWLLRWWGA